MKGIYLALVLCGHPILLWSCDICGSGVGNNYIGILPEFKKAVTGIRYRSNQLLTHVGVGGNTTYLTTKEKYKTVECWSAMNLGRNSRIMLSVPYHMIQKINQNKKISKTGIGDISLIGYFKLFDFRSNLSNKVIKQSLWLGSGIQMPTGNYSQKVEVNDLNLFQLGTGAFSGILQLTYDIRMNNWGVNGNGLLKMNNENQTGYCYGNSINLNLQVYRKWKWNKWGTFIYSGVLLERSGLDMDGPITVYSSGGRMSLGTFGNEISWKKWGLGWNYQWPLAQILAHGIAHAKDRLMIHFNYEM